MGLRPVTPARALPEACHTAPRATLAEEKGCRFVTPDHHTGGLTVSGPQDRLPAPGEAVDVTWANKVHGGEDVVFWSQGPGSQALGRAIDNTDLYRVMREALSTR